MGKSLFSEGLRKCYVCKEIKSIDDFGISNRAYCHGRTYQCKECYINLRNNFERQRNIVLKRLGLKCNKCGIENNNLSFFDIDHIVPIKKSSNRRNLKMSEIDNYMVLCPNCHRLKTISGNEFK